MSTAVRTPNRLIDEKSPYLLQHAHNPVDWFPWGEEAFAKAKRENKPIFLSIGYSTCHWCHVMERESFEDDEVAAVLNEHFVAIKVDREERPDVDQVYMDVCQALTGQGGWPLTVLLTPEREPFFAATYLPKRSRGGWTGLVDLLRAVATQWRTDPARLSEVSRKITESLRHRNTTPGRGAAELGPEVLDAAVATLAGQFDPEYGGFGRAPKFPLPHQLIFLLYQGALTGNAGATAMAERTLGGMRRGGLCDQVGLGFSRYSTDRRWLVPHFEKMLYDNALLALAYLDAVRLTGESRWGRAAREIFTYVRRDLTGNEGAFYAAEDADSEGVEGKFYLWTPAEVEAVLGPEQGREFCARFDITPAGNFGGRSIPNLIHRVWPAGEEEEKRLGEARERLWAAREKRVHPYKDDKVLTAWNGLMIAALARGAATLDEPAYAQAAARAADFLWHHVRRPDGRLLARYRDGEAAYLGYLDDYAFLAWGLLELYEATYAPGHLARCLTLVRDMQALFWDEQDGGYFFAGRDAEELFLRPKEFYDGALPSGNSVAALVLTRLAHLTGDPALEEEASQAFAAAAAPAASHPTGHTLLLHAAQWRLHPVSRVVVSGPTSDPEVRAMLGLLRRSPAPLLVTLHHPGGEPGAELERLVPPVAEQAPRRGRPAAYLCREGACLPPVQTAAGLGALLTR
ncbi:MAG: thioredoxin domain-containing protein [Chitinophagales bacterium]